VQEALVVSIFSFGCTPHKRNHGARAPSPSRAARLAASSTQRRPRNEGPLRYRLLVRAASVRPSPPSARPAEKRSVRLRVPTAWLSGAKRVSVGIPAPDPDPARISNRALSRARHRRQRQCPPRWTPRRVHGPLSVGPPVAR